MVLSIDDIALSVAGPLALRLRGTKLYKRLERNLRASLTFTSPERYLARVLFMTITLSAALIPTGSLLMLLNINDLLTLLRLGLIMTENGVRVLFLFTVGLIMVFIPLITYGIMINLPRISSSDLAFKVDSELPFFAAYVSAIANSGLSVFKAVERIASIRILSTMSRLARWAYIRFRVYGEDPLSALSSVASSVSSRAFSEFISGYVTTVRTGGDVIHYIDTRLHDIVNEAAERVKRAAEFLGTLMESYIGAAAILLIGLDVLYLSQAVTPFGDRYAAFMQAINSNYMFGLFVVPGITLAFIYLGEISTFRTPYTDYRPYKWAGASIAVAASLGLLEYILLFHGDLSSRIQIPSFPLPLDFTVIFGISLVASFLPTAIVANKLVTERIEVDKEYAEFLRDATELRKSGFTPEKIFEILRSTRRYGVFDEHLDRIVRQVRYGVPIREVLSSIIPKLHSYLSRVFTFLLVETIDLGGASPQVLDMLASFANSIVTVQEGMRARLRPLRYVPYIGVAILVLTLVILIFSVVAIVTQIGASGATAITGNLINLLATSFSFTITIDAFLMGLIAGKLGEGELAMGFKHGVAMVAIVVITYMLSPYIANTLFGSFQGLGSQGSV